MSGTVMGEAFLESGVKWNSVANTALKAATRFWFTVTVIGQMMLAVYVALYYGGSAARGQMEAWGRHLTHGWVAGDAPGNTALAAHLLAAILVSAGGGIQLIPGIRERAPRLHRWMGRIYILTAVATSVAGLYMVWVRGSVGDLSQHLGSTGNAILIVLFAGLALSSAMARRISVHRRWALRLFLVVSASWFLRVMLFFWLIVNHGPAGFNPKTFTGPALTILTFAQYLLPLAVLQVYLRVQNRAGAAGRFAMAAALVLLTLATVVGLFGTTMGIWLPTLRAGHMKFS